LWVVNFLAKVAKILWQSKVNRKIRAVEVLAIN